MHKNSRVRNSLRLGLLLSMLAACAPQSSAPTIASTPIPVATSTLAPAATPAASPAPTDISPAEPATPASGVSFTTSDGITLAGTLYGSGSTAIILSNMGDNDPAPWDAFAPGLAGRGYQVLTYKYRYPTRTTRFDSDMANHTLDDLRAAIAFMREQGAQRLVLVGASLGGMATAKAAATENPAAVVIIASPIDLSDYDFVVEQTELDAITAPKLFVGGQGDQIVPFADVQQMFDLSPQPKQLHAYPGTAHGVELFRTEHGDDLRQRLIAFIETNAPAASALPGPRLLAELDIQSQTGTAYTLDWSPDGARLAVASGNEVTFIDRTFKEEFVWQVEGVLALAWSPDGQQAASVNGFRNPLIRIWEWHPDSRTFDLSRSLSGGGSEYGVSWSVDGRTLATLADDRRSTIELWDTSTWQIRDTLRLPYANPLRALDWSTDSTQIMDAGVSAVGNTMLFAARVAGGEDVELHSLPSDVAALAVSSDGSRLAYARNNQEVVIQDMAMGSLLAGFRGVAEPVDLDWSPDGDKLAVLGYHTALQIWSIDPVD